MHGRNEWNESRVCSFFSVESKNRVFSKIDQTVIFCVTTNPAYCIIPNPVQPELSYPPFPLLKMMCSTLYPPKSIGQLIMSYLSPKDFQRWSAVNPDKNKHSAEIEEMIESAKNALLPAWAHLISEVTKNYFNVYGLLGNNETVKSIVYKYNLLLSGQALNILENVCSFSHNWREHLSIKNQAFFFAMSEYNYIQLFFLDLVDKKIAEGLKNLINAGALDDISIEQLKWKVRSPYSADIVWEDFCLVSKCNYPSNKLSLNALHSLTCYISLCLTGTCMHNNYDCTVCYWYRFPTIPPVFWTPVLAASLYGGPLSLNVMLEYFPDKIEVSLKGLEAILAQENNFYFYNGEENDNKKGYCLAIDKELAFIAKKYYIAYLNKIRRELFNRIDQVMNEQQCIELFENNINSCMFNYPLTARCYGFFCQNSRYSSEKIAFIEAIQGKILTFQLPAHSPSRDIELQNLQHILPYLEKILAHEVFSEIHIKRGVKSQLRSQLVREVERLKNEFSRQNSSVFDEQAKQYLSIITFTRY